MTHAEALVYAAAFSEQFRHCLAEGMSQKACRDGATFAGWVTVAALRHAAADEDQGTRSEMLAEFRAFGQDGAKDK